MKFRVIISLFISSHAVFSQFGPGGVGSSVDNGLWLKASTMTHLLNGDTVDRWDDRSGNNNHAINMTAGEQPVFRTSSSINGRQSIYFDGNLDQMLVADDPILDGTEGITFYTVIRPDNLDGNARGILGKRVNYSTSTDYAYTFFFWGSNYLTLDIHKQNDRFNSSPNTYSNNTNYMLGFDFDGTKAASDRSRLLNAGSVVVESPETSTSLPETTSPLVLGGLNFNYLSGGSQTRLGGDYAEVIHYGRILNTAERKIVENYLGARYEITITDPLYFHSAYAGEVAGIGRDNSTNFHDDAQGSAIVRINSPSNLSDNNFMLWGHNESSIDAFDTLDVDGTIIETRMSRVWAISKTGDVGNVRVAFDLFPFSPIMPSDIRLLIDRNDNGFADNDITPVTGSISDSTITFEGVKFEDGDKFTLGSVNFDQTPLPVELTEFYLKSNERNVNVQWTTASELNSDYFLLSKSKDGKVFHNFAEIKGAGTISTVSNYNILDDNPYSGVSYYRLIQVDFDGEKTVYGPISVRRKSEPKFLLVPNPTNGSFYLKSTNSTTENTELTIYSSVGKLVSKVNLLPKDLNNKTIDLGLTPGVYFIQINQENGFYSAMKLVVK